MKRTIIVVLIAACVGVTLYINSQTKRLPDAVKRQAEDILLADALFPARPVWWEDDKILAVGVVAERTNGEQAARKACELFTAENLPVGGLRIEVYDILEIQRNDEWTLIGKAVCNAN